jgi:hypothetical protein
LAIAKHFYALAQEELKNASSSLARKAMLAHHITNRSLLIAALAELGSELGAACLVRGKA